MTRPLFYELDRHSPSAKGLRIWYPGWMDGASTVFDRSGFASDATWLGTINWTGSDRGTVAVCKEGTGIMEPEEVAGGFWHEAYSARTFMVWVSVKSDTASAKNFFQQGNSPVNGFVVLYRTANDFPDYTLGIDSNTVSLDGANNSIPTGDGLWYHLVVTFHLGIMEMVINGVSQGINTVHRDAARFTVEANTNDPAIGKPSGLYDDFRAYDRALSLGEIQRIWAMGAANPLSDLIQPRRVPIGKSTAPPAGNRRRRMILFGAGA